MDHPFSYHEVMISILGGQVLQGVCDWQCRKRWGSRPHVRAASFAVISGAIGLITGGAIGLTPSPTPLSYRTPLLPDPSLTGPALLPDPLFYQTPSLTKSPLAVQTPETRPRSLLISCETGSGT